MEDPESTHATATTCTRNHHARKCVLCDMALSNMYNVDIDTINEYITQSISKTHPQRIADDIHEILHAKLPKNLLEFITHDKILDHIEAHMTHPTIVMTNMVRDLLQMAKTAKSKSTVQCEESHVVMLDNKSVSLYLKVIGELQVALRHDAFRTGLKAPTL